MKTSYRQLHWLCYGKVISFRRYRNHIEWLFNWEWGSIMKIYSDNFLAFWCTIDASG